MLNFIKNVSPVEWVILAAIVILIFGSKAFMTMGKTSGETYREIKKIKKNLTEAIEDEPNKNERGV